MICSRATVGAWLRRVADDINPPPPAPNTDLTALGVSVFGHQASADARQDAALSLLDEEVLGFLLAQVRAVPDGATVTLDMALDPLHRDAVNATLALLIREGEHA